MLWRVIAIALPFGYPEQYTGDPPQLVLVGGMLVPALLIAILIGVGLRRLWRRSTRAA